MTHEQSARNNHRGGSNCAQSVAAAFAADMNRDPADAMRTAPRPRSGGGMCGAFLAGTQLLSQMKPEAVETFRRRFLEENGAATCRQLKQSGKHCNDLVGCAARLTEELLNG